MAYQWYAVSENGDQSIEGATDEVFAPATGVAGSFSYYCKATYTAAAGYATTGRSNVVEVTVLEGKPAPVVISGVSEDVTVDTGEMTTLSVDASCDEGDGLVGELTYRWERTYDGENYYGQSSDSASNASFQVSEGQAGRTAYWRC